MRSRALILVVVLALVAVAAAKQEKLAPELRNAANGNNVNVIVRYKVVPGAKHRQKLNDHQAQVTNDLSSLKDMAVTLPASQVDDLSNDDDIAYVAPDRPVTGFMDTPAPAVLANYAWNRGLDGSNIAVAVIDSGIRGSSKITFKELNTWNTSTSRIVYAQSWISDGWGTGDRFGHGTHVAGLIGGNGFYSTGTQYTGTFKGIAPNVNLVDLRVLDGNGAGLDSNVIAAIQTAISLQKKYNIRVINLSLGRPVFESYKLDPLCQAVEAAYQAGIVVVVSAGNFGRDNSFQNDGYATITAPANDPYVITVGAMKMMGTPDRSDDLIATYSSKGPTLIDHIAKPDLVAPGNQLVSLLSGGAMLSSTFTSNDVPLSAYQTGQTYGLPSTSYYVMSGTSMASGVVSGAVALLLQANPQMTPDQVKARLMKTAYKTFPQYSSYTDPATGITYTDQYDVFTVGAGYLDIQAALANTALSAGQAKSPIVQYDPTTQSVYFVNDSFAVWGGSSPDWSSFAVWGGNAFVGSNFAVWGGSSPWASFAVWGGSAPWGENTDSGFFAVWGGSTVAGTSTSTTDSLSTLINGDK
jgi:serine protease AprX